MPHGEGRCGDCCRSRSSGRLLACAGVAACVAAPAPAQGSYSPYDESAAAALARYVRTLADPKDFSADRRRQGRAGARRRPGRGRFLRPRRRGQSAQPAAPGRHGRGLGRERRRAGGAALFPARAAARRAASMIGCDRGLAYDLLGRQAQAQADYRAALERRRRRRSAPPARAQPRDQRRHAMERCRPCSADGASGDVAAARPRFRSRADRRCQRRDGRRSTPRCPAAGREVAPFLQRLPALQAGPEGRGGQPRHLPGFGRHRLRLRRPAQFRGVIPDGHRERDTDRLAGIDELLRAGAGGAAELAARVGSGSPSWSARSRRRSLTPRQ